MATKSLGHLGVATGDIGSSSSAIDFNTIIGIPTAVDFEDFDGTMASELSAEPLEISVEETTNIECQWSAQGTRHNTWIASRTAIFAFDDESGGRTLELTGQSGDSITGTALDSGEDLVWCDYDDGGYNNTGYGEVTVTIY